MFNPVSFFRTLRRVPADQVAGQVSGDASHTEDVLAVAYRTFLKGRKG